MRTAMTIGFLVAASALGGCSMFGGDSDKHSRNDRDGRRAETAGYRGEMGEGRLDWTAPGIGQAVILDRDDNRVVLTQRVRQGDRIVVEPGDDRVLLNGQSIYNRNLVKDHTHAIQFQPEGGAPGRWGNGSDWRR